MLPGNSSALSLRVATPSHRVLFYPPEILARIFHFVVLEGLPCYSKQNLGVCQHWRFNNSLLWAGISGTRRTSNGFRRCLPGRISPILANSVLITCLYTAPTASKKFIVGKLRP
jgi:hypothetical protein